jgi:hypothetical protein
MTAMGRGKLDAASLEENGIYFRLQLYEPGEPDKLEGIFPDWSQMEIVREGLLNFEKILSQVSFVSLILSPSGFPPIDNY